jgi:DNA polymerase IV
METIESYSDGVATPPRKIVHIDMDAFYASVEQRDDPSLRGKPVVVAWRGARSVVCAASYEARQFGVRSAMPALRAQHLCPDAVFIPPDFTRYKAVSRAVRDILERHTDLIEPLSLDEAYLDVTENQTALPTATLVAKTIRRQIRDELHLTASAGVAPNKFLAKIASDWRKPDGLFVIQPSEVNAFLISLPIGRIPGVGKVTESRLKEIGATTVGQLQTIDRSLLEGRFGRYGRRLYELARGIDHNPVVSNRPTKSISAEDTLERDVSLSETDGLIRQLAEKVWNASRKDTRVARTVVLKLKTSNFAIMTRSLTPVTPPETCERLIDIALSLRERIGVSDSQRFRLVGVGLSNFAEIERPHCYSPRSACIGSIDAARSAGGTDAPRANRSTHTAASSSTNGSNGLTPKSIDRSSPDAAAAPVSPMTHPIAASLAPDLRTSRTIAER